jgi:phosphoserine phosphatase
MGMLHHPKEEDEKMQRMYRAFLNFLMDNIDGPKDEIREILESALPKDILENEGDICSFLRRFEDAKRKYQMRLREVRWKIEEIKDTEPERYVNGAAEDYIREARRLENKLKDVSEERSPRDLYGFIKRKSRNLQLICFDLDNTLISVDDNIWSCLNQKMNCVEESREVEEKYRKGEISYEEWALGAFDILKRKGINEKIFWENCSKVNVFPDVKRTLDALKYNGKKLAIISGGIDLLMPGQIARYFDDIFINRVEFDSRGEIKSFTPTPYGDGKYKEKGLLSIADKYRLRPSQCAFVGDGENDLQIGKRAGLSICRGPCIPKNKQFYDECDLHVAQIKDILPYLI